MYESAQIDLNLRFIIVPGNNSDIQQKISKPSILLNSVSTVLVQRIRRKLVRSKRTEFGIDNEQFREIPVIEQTRVRKNYLLKITSLVQIENFRLALN